MSISTAPVLLLGLGARILMDLVTRTEASLQDYILMGCWQGVGLWYAFKKHDLAIPVAFGIAAKMFIEYTFAQDMARTATTLLSTAVGAVATDFLAGVFDNDGPKDRRAKKVSSANAHAFPERDRARTSRRREREQRELGNGTAPARQHRTPSRRTVSDITSVDSNSELIGPRASMTPLEREVATLRARASLADSERRRFKEERKWAKEQGDVALAAQMKWQVKRYAALMKSFHREADAKIVEGESVIWVDEDNSNSLSLSAASNNTRTRLAPIEEHRPYNSGQPSRNNPSRNTNERPTTRIDIASGQVRNPIRVNVR